MQAKPQELLMPEAERSIISQVLSETQEEDFFKSHQILNDLSA